MKLTLKLSVLCAFVFAASSVMAECPTDMPYNQLVDCLVIDDSAPDITDLMSQESAKNDADMMLVKTENSEAVIAK
jgi:hypothetical protein